MADINPNAEAKLRAKALMECDILNATPESMFDDISQIASVLCDTPIAFISFFDDTKQLFKSKIGITIDEIPIQDSICFNNLKSNDDIVRIDNIRIDTRFTSNPILLEIPNIVSYYSVAIINDIGLIIGSLGVVSINEPNIITNEQIFVLKKLANQIANLLELRKQKIQLISKNDFLNPEQLADFITVATHDLKAPIRSIKSFLQLIEAKNKDVFDDKDVKYFKFVQDNVGIMEELILDLSQYVKIELLNQDKEDIDLNELVPAVFNSIKEKSFVKNVDFECEKLPIINAVSNELTLLFSNLIDNALKYNTLQDNIKLQIKYANVAQDHVFEIIDNGIGIDNEYFETIFIPFKRLHARSEYPGTGLGLAIVEKIIKKYKGRVSVSSSLGEGSKFTFTIPVK